MELIRVEQVSSVQFRVRYRTWKDNKTTRVKNMRIVEDAEGELKLDYAGKEIVLSQDEEELRKLVNLKWRLWLLFAVV